MSLLSKVKDTIDRFSLIESGDSILVGLSGGPDSVALLHLLSKMSKEFNLSLIAVYLNHNIRKQAAKKEEEFCFKLCQKLGVEFVTVSEDIPALSKKIKKGIEETARDFRYGVFKSITEEYGIDKIAVGHHYDDRVETVLFRVARGSGLKGLGGMRPKRDNIIRPLFDLTKDEILRYLKKIKQPYCIDKSNLLLNYKRNFIRNKVLPLLKKELNTSVEKALINLSDIAYEENLYLESLTEKEFKKVCSITSSGKYRLSFKKYSKLDRNLGRRILRKCLTELSENNLAPDRVVVDRLERFIAEKKSSISLPEKVQAVAVDDELILFKKRSKTFTKKISGYDEIRLEKIGRMIKFNPVKIDKFVLSKQRRSEKAAVDAAKVEWPLTIRNIKEGDRFQPLGLKGSKKVGDYLTDRKVHPLFRDDIPVICDRKGIIWLGGLEIDERVKIDEFTDEVIKIELF